MDGVLTGDRHESPLLRTTRSASRIRRAVRQSSSMAGSDAFWPLAILLVGVLVIGFVNRDKSLLCSVVSMTKSRRIGASRSIEIPEISMATNVMCSTFLVECVAKYPRTASVAVSAMGMVWLMICPFSGSHYSLRQLKKIIAINWQSSMFIKLWRQAFRIQHLSKSRIATKNPESYVALNTVSLNATLVGTISTASIGTGRSAPISLGNKHVARLVNKPT